jgi:hypothetical protein
MLKNLQIAIVEAKKEVAEEPTLTPWDKFIGIGSALIVLSMFGGCVSVVYQGREGKIFQPNAYEIQQREEYEQREELKKEELTGEGCVDRVVAKSTNSNVALNLKLECGINI